MPSPSRHNHGSPAERASASSEAERSYILAGQVVAARRPPAGLYVVATPIGNLGDITLRALETLAGVDLIACEDTRVSRRLMERFGIAAPLTPYHDHNAATARPKLIETIAKGGSVALISDAGTPLISDPGFKLVRELTAAGLPVTSLPGASSVLTALTIAGLPTDRFLFEGFLPPKEVSRRNRIAELARIDTSVVLFEGGSRIQKTLIDLADLMPDRDAAICRELTKLHEDVLRGPLPTLAADAGSLETRGEFVVVIGPPPRKAQTMSADALDDLLRTSLQHASVRDAVAEAVELSGLPRRDVYARALELSRAHGDDTTPEDEA